MHAGLYEPERPRSLAGALERVRLLNPNYAGDDPVALRFAQLEID